MTATEELLERPVGGVWLRSGADLLDVSFPKRTVELVVIPYETPAIVGWNGRRVRETIARGAFDGIERRANRVRANREHSAMFTIGRALSFHPSRQEGLVANVKIAQTDLGTETLELAADGCLNASAGFQPMQDGVSWERSDAYRITRAWLDHIAFTSRPVYEDARVLAVRSRGEPASKTPNLDQVRQWRRDEALASDPLYR